ncbi:hypothetical protein [Crocosphaera sp. Alani8]|uniref:hypothetical protein n=1 Tax=Crocosphaera sp. Alani8 TaxID=3038952 RepID=UPI00313C4717
MSIKRMTRMAFDTVVIFGFLMGTGFLFNHILETPLSNPFISDSVTAEEEA